VTLDDTWTVEVDSGGAAEETAFAGLLGGDRALVRRPA